MVTARERLPSGKEMNDMKCLIGMVKYCTVLSALIVLSCRGAAPQHHEMPKTTVFHVNVCSVVRDSVALPLSLAGRLATSTELKLGFKTGGIIRSVFVDEGAMVSRGTPLASLDTAELAAWRMKAQTAVEKTSRDLARAKRLYADSVATNEQLQNAQSALDAAEADLDIAQFNCSQALLTAPARGRVLKRLAENNEVIGSGMPVVILASAEEAWEVKASVPDVDLPQLSVGDSASVTFDAVPGKLFTGRLVKIAPVAHPVTGTFEIEIALDKGDAGLRYGLFAAVSLCPRKQRHLCFIPASALASADGRKGVVVAPGENGSCTPVNITIERMAGDIIAVSDGLASVSEVVSAGASFALTSGEKIVFDRQVER